MAYKYDNYGELFRELRLGKNITLKEVAGDKVSISSVSKFENNETSISLENFLYLLVNLNTTVSEFFIRANDSVETEINNIMLKASNLYMNNNIIGMEYMMEDLGEKYEKTNNIKYKLYEILVESFLLDTNHKLSEKDTQILINYLFDISDWGKFELIIFGNCIFQLPISVVEIFLDEIEKRTEIFSNEENYKIKLGIKINALTKYLFDEDISKLKVDRFVRKIKKEYLKLDDILLYEKLNFKFLLGVFEIMNDNIIYGRAECEEVLAILKSLNSSKVYIKLNELYKKVSL